MIKKILSKINYIYKLYLLRDPFFISIRKWFLINGDETLRLEYLLDDSSIVFDVGGYKGDYAEAINKKFGCRVYLFEPVPAFYDECVKRFSGNSLITCFNFGLSSHTSWLDIGLDDNASSFKTINSGEKTQRAQVRSILEVYKELNLRNIDLIKINIEGGEFDLLPAIISSGIVKNIKYIQVQFHNFIEGAVNNRLEIRELLESSHREMWNYEFVWESWERF